VEQSAVKATHLRPQPPAPLRDRRMVFHFYDVNMNRVVDSKDILAILLPTIDAARHICAYRLL
jgi:hypothetical protein